MMVGGLARGSLAQGAGSEPEQNGTRPGDGRPRSGLKVLGVPNYQCC